MWHRQELRPGEDTGVSDVSGGFSDAPLGLWIAPSVVEARAVELSEATVITAQERPGFRITVRQSVQLVGGPCSGDRLLTGTSENESIRGTLGGAPGLLSRIPNVAGFEAFHGLVVNLSRIGKELDNAVLD